MKKHKYIKPEVEIVELNTESLLNTLSVAIGEGPGPGGGGQAKEFSGLEEDFGDSPSESWDD